MSGLKELKESREPARTVKIQNGMSQGKIMELIRIDKTKHPKGIETVNARDLHGFLESKQDFSTWIKSRIEKYKFYNGIDFIRFHKKMEANNATMIEYYISIDMAKELCMIENNFQGRKARRYFIERDNQLRELSACNPPKLPDFSNPVEAARAWADAKEKELLATAALSAAQPKIEFHDATIQSPDLQSVAEFANTLNKRNIQIGEKRLFKWFYENKYLIYHNRPYQSALNAGYFEVAQIEGTDYRNRPLMYNKVFVTGKGRIFFTKKIIADLYPPITDNVQLEVEV